MYIKIILSNILSIFRLTSSNLLESNISLNNTLISIDEEYLNDFNQILEKYFFLHNKFYNKHLMTYLRGGLTYSFR